MAPYNTIDLEAAADVPSSKSRSRKTIGVAVLCAAAFVAGTSAPSAAKTLTSFIETGKKQIIITKKDWMEYGNGANWCLQADTDTPVAGTKVRVKKCDKSDVRQHWTIYDNGEDPVASDDAVGRVQYNTQGKGDNGKLVDYCLDLQGNDEGPKGTFLGHKIKLYPCSKVGKKVDDNQNIVFSDADNWKDKKLVFAAIDDGTVVDGENTNLCVGTGRKLGQKNPKGMQIEATFCGHTNPDVGETAGDVYWHWTDKYDY
jgi:hypothetical protein